MSNQSLRQRPGAAAPPAGTYAIDPERSTVSFTTRHFFSLARVRGSFGLHEGQIRIADPVEHSSATAVVPAASFSTGNDRRDANVRSPKLLGADTYPLIVFTSERLEHAGEDWVLHGSLSVRGRSAPVAVLLGDIAVDGPTLRASAAARIDRYAFGVSRQKGLIGRHLDLTLDVVASRS